jgi:hypothetical protein
MQPEAAPPGRAFRAEPLLTAALVVAAILPTVAFRYLPMTDLPQHAAVVAILRHLHDPQFGLEPFYQVDLGRTLSEGAQRCALRRFGP